MKVAQQKKQQTDDEIEDKKSYESRNKTKKTITSQGHLAWQQRALNTSVAVGEHHCIRL